jgi:hypothetical protein
LRNRHLVIAVSAIFSASSALFATSLQAAPMAALLAAILGANLLLWRGIRDSALLAQEIEIPWLLALLVLGAALALLGGEGHLAFAKDDWLVRDGVLTDLALHPLPVRYEADGQEAILRAPLGFYLLPAAFGRLFGLGAAHMALVAQTAVILASFFYLTTLVWPKRRGLFVFLFVLFAGPDVLPVLMKTGGAWLPRYLAFWVDKMYYPPNLSQLFWSPNHLLPGWWFAALAALYLKREIDFATLAVSTVPLLFWSPLTTPGCALLLVYFFLAAPRAALTPRLAGASLCVLGVSPILAFFLSGAGETPLAFAWHDPEFWNDYPIFVLFSLPQAFFALALWRRVDPPMRGALVAAVALLLSIPLIRLGSMSDFQQRASIAPHALVAFLFDALLIELLPGGGLALAIGAAFAAVGAVGPALEIWDTLSTPRWSISDCNMATINRKYTGHATLMAHYFAPAAAVPTWLFRAGPGSEPLRPEERTCWSDRVYADERFNYMLPEHRIWLRRDAGAQK